MKLKPYDLYSVQNATVRNANYEAEVVRVASEITADSRRDERQKQLKCKACFYRSAGVHGQGFTEWECCRCGEAHVHPNTGIPALCRKCAKETGLCVSCIADREGLTVVKLP